MLHLVDDLGSRTIPDLLRAIDPERYEVQLLVLRGISEDLARILEDGGIHVVRAAPASRRQYPEAFIRLVRLLKRSRVDILHTHAFDASILGVLAARVARTGCVVHRRHADTHHLLDKPWHRRIDQLAAKLAHRVIAVSHATREVLVLREGVREEKVRVVHNGVDLSLFDHVTEEDVHRFRLELNLTDEFILTVPARLYFLKGHIYLLEALSRLLIRSGTPLVLLLVGTGPARANLEDAVRHLGIEDMVRFLGWRPDLPVILTASDVVVLPTLTESFGLVVVEAMAAGSCVVASKVGGVPEIVEDGTSGLLVPPASVDCLFGAVLHLVNDSETRARMGEAGRRRAGEFSIGATAHGCEAVYDEIVRMRRD